MIKKNFKLNILLILTLPFLTLFTYAGPLEDYVNLPDPSYGYTINAQESGIGYTYYVVKLTSQTWRSSSEVNRILWEHWLTIIVPSSITKTKGLLIVSGGNNGDPATNLRTYAQYIAILTGAPVALLEQVPNQPLRFAGESKNRTEDEIIAYSFDKYLQTYDSGTPDPYWPVLLPMVKSAVRAMDTIQTIVQNNHGKNINGFVVSGASKRGWTTWLTSAVDSRIIAIVPMVIDVLKMDIQMDHHYKCYGFFAPTLKPYNDLQIFERMNTPGGLALRQIVDPYSYLSNYTMPKFIINACGDEFFLPDSSRFYYHKLPGERRLRYVPNVGHSLGDNLDLQTVYPLIVYFNSVAGTGSRPNYSWEFLPDGNIKVQLVQNPTSVTLWQATNPSARDFRYDSGIGPQWTSTALSETTPGSKTYITQITPPTSGWKAYMVEINFSNGSYIFTTDIGIMPYMRPYDDLDEDGLMDTEDPDDDCDWIRDEVDEFPWDSDNDGIPNYLDEIDDRDPSEIPNDCLNIPEDVVVPYVIGLSLHEANSTIIDASLIVGTISYICDNVIPSGNVVSQEPTAGTIIREGSKVNLWISEGPCSQEGEGIIEGEGIPEGTPEGEGIAEGEGIPEGTPEGEGIAEGEGIPEGTPEGEGIAEGEGIPEGTPEGEGIAEGEGIPEGTPEGEGIAEGEGIPEGTAEGEGIAEGTAEGEGITEGEGTEEGTMEGSAEGEGEKTPHSADPDGDWKISLTELLRVIQFFNTGGYHCALPEEESEDGYIPGFDGDKSCFPHNSDYNQQDWIINLSELLRIIQFFNSGGYYPCFGSEDGYCVLVMEH